MNKSHKILFFGNERLASSVSASAPLLRSLVDAKYDVVGIVVQQARQTGRKQAILEIAEVANEHNIPVYSPATEAETLEVIKKSGADTGVLAAYGKIVSEAVISSFRFGILNVHPSLLPEYRGSTPIETAILNGDTKTGVSIMSLGVEMDAGPLYGFSELSIEPGISKQNLYEQLSEIGAALLLSVLPTVFDYSVVPLGQDHEAATYTKQINKADGQLDFNKPASQLEREIRAYLGWPGSYTKLNNIEATITSAHVSDESGRPGELFQPTKNTLGIYCSEGALIIDRLKPAGKPEMDVASFLNGYKHSI